MRTDSSPPIPPETSSREEIVRWYHRRSKHQFHAFAPGPGRMDWASRPEEFRRYAGAEVTALDRPEETGPAYDRLYTLDQAPEAVDHRTVSSFLYHSLAVSAWKHRSGASWALRVNPSSGNLHPLEAYLAAGGDAGLDRHPAIYHYSPPEHGLERLQRLENGLWKELTSGLPCGAFLVGCTVIHWRCSWKYGERAWRYCRLDAGHALAALRLSAAALGWDLRLLHLPQSRIADLLGLGRQKDLPAHQRETPELLAAVFPRGAGGDRLVPPAASVTSRVAGGKWEGRLDCPDSRHRDWPAVETVERACRAEDAVEPVPAAGPPVPAPALDSGTPHSAFAVIRGRRSATGMDREGRLDAGRFYPMMGRLLPVCFSSPWDALGSAPLADLHLMVHRVDGLAPGLYTLVRQPGGKTALAGAMNPEFSWQKPPGCPDWLPLHLNLPMDLTDLAEGLSCGQEMAGDAVFTLGMTADLEGALRRFGAPVYRRLYQEAGMIGQVLYLEAEAAGLRGCGIGCYFDDGVHKLLGSDPDIGPQSLYHFVVGRNVPERGAERLPAYPAPGDA